MKIQLNKTLSEISTRFYLDGSESPRNISHTFICLLKCSRIHFNCNIESMQTYIQAIVYHVAANEEDSTKMFNNFLEAIFEKRLINVREENICDNCIFQ